VKGKVRSRKGSLACRAPFPPRRTSAQQYSGVTNLFVFLKQCHEIVNPERVWESSSKLEKEKPTLQD